MKVHVIDLSVSTTVYSSADLYTIANGNLNLDADGASTAISGAFAVKAQGSTILGAVLGGDSQPVMEIQPSYYPKAILGAECAAHVTDLTWADQNLYDGYQFVPTNRGFIVAGVLNSTQTDANDPFASSLIVSGQASCWKESYSRTFQIFD
jgi:hypothetical protein